MCVCVCDQVTGYVLIVSNSITELHLEQLRIIRGENLFTGEIVHDEMDTSADVTMASLPSPKPVKHRKFSVYIVLNYNPNSTVVGLHELRLNSLRGNFTVIIFISTVA